MNVAKHLKWHGLVALVTAAASMIMLRGLKEPQLIVGFSLPPAVAVAFTSPQHSTRARTIAQRWAIPHLVLLDNRLLDRRCGSVEYLPQKGPFAAAW